jgi:hypothetical protein
MIVIDSSSIVMQSLFIYVESVTCKNKEKERVQSNTLSSVLIHIGVAVNCSYAIFCECEMCMLSN